MKSGLILLFSIKASRFHRSLQGPEIQDLSKTDRLHRGFHRHTGSKTGRFRLSVQDLAHLSIDRRCGLPASFCSSLAFKNCSVVLQAFTYSILEKIQARFLFSEVLKERIELGVMTQVMQALRPRNRFKFEINSPPLRPRSIDQASK